MVLIAARPPGLPARHVARLAAAALDRRPLLRDLPLALADHRPHHARRRRDRRRACCATLLQVAAIFGVSALSWRFVEEPIRHGAIGRLWRARRAARLALGTVAPRGLGVAIVGAGGPGRRRGRRHGRASTRPRAEGDETRGSRRRGAAGTTTPVAADPGPGRVLDAHVLQSGRPHRRLDLRGPRLGRIPADREPADRRPVRRSRAPKTATWRSPGARSIEEQFEGEPNAQEVAESLEGRRLQRLLGAGARAPTRRPTSPPARHVGERERIEKMMTTIGDEPVLWVNVRSLVEARRPLLGQEHEEVGRGTASPPAPRTRTCASTTGPPTSKTPGSSKTASTSPRPATPPARADRPRPRARLPGRRHERRRRPLPRALGALAVRAALRGGHVERGVAVEEADRAQLEAAAWRPA